MIDKINNFILYHPYTISLILVFSSIIVGFIIKKVLTLISIIVNRFTSFSFKDLIAYSFKNIPIIYMTIYGIYYVIRKENITPGFSYILTNLFSVFNIVISILLVFRLVVNYINLKGKDKNSKIGNISNTSILDNIIKTVAYIIAIIIILGKFNVSITPIITALGVGGIAVALALQDVLSNLFSGVYVISTAQLKPGDYIKMPSEDVEGIVCDISWRNTIVRSIYNEYIYIPNSKISTSIINNYSQTKNGYVFTVPITIDFKEDLEKVETLIIHTAKVVLNESDSGISDYEPCIKLKEFGEYGINIAIILKSVNYSCHSLLKHQFMKELTYVFNEAKISFATPISNIKFKME